MKHLIESVRQSIRCCNQYAALTAALALPDIAAELDGRPGNGSRERYVSWFNDYLLPKYTLDLGGPGPYTFLTGDDCYALRCAFLHEGDFDITDQRARKLLDRFQFVMPISSKSIMHLNQLGDTTLQLQVDLFVEEICSAAEEWMRIRGSDPDVSRRIAELPKIYFS